MRECAKYKISNIKHGSSTTSTSTTTTERSLIVEILYR